MDPLLKNILCDKVIMQNLTKYLTMKEIICLSSTSREMHSKWINRKGVHLYRHLLSYFKWKTLKGIGPFKTFQKHIFASLHFPGPCIGGCGKLETTIYQCVPRFISKYNLCTECFRNMNVAAHMEKRGLLPLDHVYMHHRKILMEKAVSEFSQPIVDDFFSQNNNNDYTITPIAAKYYSRDSIFMGYIRVSTEIIEERAIVHSSSLFDDMRRHVLKKYEEATAVVTRRELDLVEAKERLTKRRKMYDEVFE